MAPRTTADREAIRANVTWTQPAWLRTVAGVATMFAPFLLMVIVGQPAIGILVAVAFFGLVGSAFRVRRADDAMVILRESGIAVKMEKTERVVRRSEVASAFDDAGRGVTTLDLAGGARYELAIADSAARERLLTHLGQTLVQRALVAPLRGNLGAFTRGLLAFFVALLVVPLFVAILTSVLGPGFLAWTRGMVSASPLVAALAAAIVVKRIGSPRVVVGSDGVRLEGRLVPRFIPYTDIAELETTPVLPNGIYGVSLLLKGGRAILLPTVAQSEAQVRALVRRIQEGRRRFGASEGPPLAVLERAGREVDAWRADLARQAKGGGFRTAPLDPVDLEDLIDDAAAPLDRRVGAALALRDLTGDTERVRVAAERAADERVRVALAEVASDEVDDDRLARALESAPPERVR